MTVPTPNSAALDPVPDPQPPARAAEASEQVGAAPASLATPTALSATASIAATATHRASTIAAPAAPDPNPGFGADPPSNDAQLGAPEAGRAGGGPTRLRAGWHTMRARTSADQPKPGGPEPAAPGSDQPGTTAARVGGGSPRPQLLHSAVRPAPPHCDLRPPLLHSGLILGRDDTGHPVAVPMLTAEPARATVVGSRRLAQIIVLRTLALGAAAVITTADPPAWHGFGRAATGEADRVVVLPPGRAVTAFGTADQPALVVCDGDDTAATAAPPRGPWQTWLTVLSTLPGNARELADGCRFLLVESPDRDDTLVLVQGGESRRVHLTPTAVERQAFGEPFTARAGTTPAVPAARRPGA